MSSNWRRFEVLLPLQFNDGRDVPPDWLAEAVLEIVDNFGAASYETQKVEGHWRHGGVVYRDNLVRIVVDVPDAADNRRWLQSFKARWKARLEHPGRPRTWPRSCPTGAEKGISPITDLGGCLW
jgi:hypothetical protein